MAAGDGETAALRAEVAALRLRVQVRSSGCCFVFFLLLLLFLCLTDLLDWVIFFFFLVNWMWLGVGEGEPEAGQDCFEL